MNNYQQLKRFSYFIRIAPLVAIFSATILLSNTIQAENDDLQSGDNISTGLPEFPVLSDFDVIMQRPLFNNNRQPGQKSTMPSGGDEQALRSSWKLTGVSITSDRAIALFEERKGSQRLRLETGMLLDGNWQLDEINADAVSVISGDQVVRLELRQPRETEATPPASGNANQQPIASDSAAPNATKTPTAPTPQDRSRQKRTM